jgi:hypothetical protein
MIWEAIAGGIKGLGETVLGFIKEFHIEPAEAFRLEQAVRQATMDFQRQMWDLEAQDRHSARQREVATGDPTTRRLAYVYTCGYFGIFLCLITGLFTVAENIKQLIDVLLAVLTAGQYSILTYYFGSSNGSTKKTQMIEEMNVTTAKAATLLAEKVPITVLEAKV